MPQPVVWSRVTSAWAGHVSSVSTSATVREKYSIIVTIQIIILNTFLRASHGHNMDQTLVSVLLYNKPVLTKKEIKSLPHSSHGSI